MKENHKNLSAQLESVEQDYRTDVSAVIADEDEIDMKISEARASKPKREVLLAIYNAYKAVESAQAEIDKVKEEIEQSKQSGQSVKEAMSRLRKEQQATNQQVRAWAYVSSCANIIGSYEYDSTGPIFLSLFSPRDTVSRIVLFVCLTSCGW